MLTKRDKLLIRPWIDLRYKNHRRKVCLFTKQKSQYLFFHNFYFQVQSAEPVIDFRPPTAHPHVTIKLKKIQKEIERKEEIKKENIRLLQKLGSIMVTKRIENFWTCPRPKYNKITI